MEKIIYRLFMYQSNIEIKNKDFLENFLILENEIPKNIVVSYFYDEDDNFKQLSIKLKNMDFLNDVNLEKLLFNFKNTNPNNNDLLKEYKNFLKKIIPLKFNENDGEEIKFLFNQIP